MYGLLFLLLIGSIMGLTPLKRKSFDIGIFGPKNRGKTMLMVSLLKKRLDAGHIIISNLPLEFEHIYIDSLAKFKCIRNLPIDQPKTFAGDDFERWALSRQSSSNIDLNSICLDFGKLNTSLIFTAKRPMAIDISLRNQCDLYYFVELVSLDGSNDLFLEKLGIRYQIFDYEGRYLGNKTLINLTKYANMYNTQYLVSELIK